MGHPLLIPSVCAEREQKKEHAQYVLALCNPGHRFDVDGMQREQRGYHGAAAGVTRGRLQHPEQQHHVEGVQEQAGGMVRTGVEAEPLAI